MSETISFDRFGMPLLWVPTIQANVGFFPTTKISFEYFLCDRSAAQSFDNAWYTKILESNGRIAAGEIKGENFEMAMITGVTIDEIGRFSRWLGQSRQDVRLPTNDEWSAVYEYASSRPQIPVSMLCPTSGYPDRIYTLIKNLSLASENITPARGLFGNTTVNPTASNLARQMLLSQGIGEWVLAQENGFAHCGARGGLMRRLDGDGHDPSNPRLLFKDRDDTRPRYVGFRLLVASKS